jgi:hypothetical protein
VATKHILKSAITVIEHFRWHCTKNATILWECLWLSRRNFIAFNWQFYMNEFPIERKGEAIVCRKFDFVFCLAANNFTSNFGVGQTPLPASIFASLPTNSQPKVQPNPLFQCNSIRPISVLPKNSPPHGQSTFLHNFLGNIPLL